MAGTSKTAFTLAELLVVVTIMVVLLALLAPAVEQAVAEARKATCAANQRSIHSGVVMYATQNKGELFPARGRQVPSGIDGANPRAHSDGRYNRPGDLAMDWPGALASVGLASSRRMAVESGRLEHKPLNMWICPTLTAFREPVWSVGDDSWIVGYQYMGGIETWRNPAASEMESLSPLRLNTARGGWTLLGELVYKFSGTWFSPVHPDAGGRRASGANHAYVDGSVNWVEFNDLYFLHSWGSFSTTVVLLHQADLDGFEPPRAEDYE